MERWWTRPLRLSPSWTTWAAMYGLDAGTVAVATSHDAAALNSADIVVQDLTRCAVDLQADHLVLTAIST
jgi:hypothetical protein